MPEDEKRKILYLIGKNQLTIIKRLKRLPDNADDEDICMALDEILYELSAGQ